MSLNTYSFTQLNFKTTILRGLIIYVDTDYHVPRYLCGGMEEGEEKAFIIPVMEELMGQLINSLNFVLVSPLVEHYLQLFFLYKLKGTSIN